MIVRFNPYRDVRRFPGSDPSNRNQLPYDAVRRDGQVELRFDLPGFTVGDLDVSVDGPAVAVTAERSTDPDDGETLIRRGRWFGKVARTINFGDDVDTDTVDASFANGVLTLKFGVTETPAPRQIEITSDPVKADVGSEVAA